jgi:hypothetical protein
VKSCNNLFIDEEYEVPPEQTGSIYVKLCLFGWTHAPDHRVPKGMTTTPQEPQPDPDVVPSGDPAPIPTPDPPPQPGEEPRP